MTTRTCAVPTPYGDVTTRLYSPQPTSQATLYYLHGGGFILGNLDTHDRIMRLLARYTGCTVIGIDYSLSPQARYPQAIEETVAVCSWQPLAKTLSQQLPGETFHIQPLDLHQMQEAVNQGTVQFVITNPAQFVQLNSHAPLRWLASLRSTRD
ncbi:acetyl esterase, partial [Salmonella enterica subsp. enterica serovar Heidelberg str. RI-11-013374]